MEANLGINQRIIGFNTSTEHTFTQLEAVNNLEICISAADTKSLILDFFCNKLRPISVLREALFKHLILPVLFFSVNENLSDESVLHLVLETSTHIKNAIKLRIKQTIFALKIDLIVGPKLIIMGIHAQHIFNKEIQLYTLNFQEIRNNTTDDQLRIMILEVLYSYKIDVNQILTITTDLNVLSNMEIQGEILRIVNHFKSACNDFVHFVGCTRTIPAIRLIQKCIKRFLINSEVESHLIMCYETIQKHDVPSVKQDLNSNNTYSTVKPPFNCWKSALDMVNKFLELQANNGTEKLPCIATPEQSKFFEEFVSIFNSIQKLIIKLEDSTLFRKNTLSSLYIMLMELKLFVKNNSKTILGTIFLNELEKSFSFIMKDHIFLSSIYLDPRIRICLDENQSNDVKILLGNLYKKKISLKTKSQGNICVVIPSAHIPSKLSTANYKSPFQEYLETLEISRSQEIEQRRFNLDLSSYELECINRLPMETNILEFWSRKQNSLTELANAIQAIPITQVTIERDLLAYDYVKNNKLVLNDVENILQIKCNCKFKEMG